MLSPEQRTPRNFYGANSCYEAKQLEHKAFSSRQPVTPYILKDLLNGPSTCWKVFKRQEDALNCSKAAKFGVMTFAFEPQNSTPARLFLSAHPEVFWHYDAQRPPSERCSYEVITESATCKLYADLEFDRVCNPGRDGSEMVNIFVDVVSKGLNYLWKVGCSKDQVLNLDSSSELKFSRHLIFNSSFCFIDNFDVGAFLKEISRNVTESVDSGTVTKLLSGISVNDLRKLYVKDSKGNDKLFCDLCVYSKNRHFRLYGSTKKGKNSHLTVSPDNTLPIRGELDTFLCSLVTNVRSDCRVLECKCISGETSVTPRSAKSLSEEATPSPHPEVDQFINRVVAPGQIFKSFYFSSSNLLVYSIVGNRFCGNVNRQHKSNNVKYIVDLDKCEYYQKCYDVDCSSYRSPPSPLPPEIAFLVSDDDDGAFDSDSQGVFKFIDQVVPLDESNSLVQRPLETKATFQKFPSFGLPDEDFLLVDEF